jgi:hypothetical protein
VIVVPALPDLRVRTLTLLGVGLAVAPLGRARAGEIPVLRLLGGTDADALRFALVEGGGLGALAGLMGALFALTLGALIELVGARLVGQGSVLMLASWLAGGGVAGALASAVAFRAARSARPSGP